MPEKPKAFRNTIATTRIGDAVVNVSIGNAALDVMSSMPDGIMGMRVRCASGLVYVHGAVNSSAPSTKVQIAGSGVLSDFIPCARAAKVFLSLSINSSDIDVLPIVGVAGS